MVATCCGNGELPAHHGALITCQVPGLNISMPSLSFSPCHKKEKVGFEEGTVNKGVWGGGVALSLGL